MPVGSSGPRATGVERSAATRDLVTRATVGGEDAVPMTVEGRVLDGTTGVAQGGVEVQFTLPGPEGPRAEVIATSADDGRFRVEITSGRWDVRAHGAGVWAPPTRLLVESAVGATTVHHDVLVERAGVVRGRVVRDDGTVVAAATVSVETTDPTTITALDETLGRSAIAGADGRFELTVPPGEIKLHATADDASEGFAAAKVASGAEITVDIVIPRAAAIAGVVRDADGAPVGGARVHVFGRVLGGGADQQLTATTDASGAYRIATVHPATVTIEATLDAASSAPVKLAVAAGDDVTVDLALGTPIAVSGHVVTSDGEPVAGARVRAVLQGARTKIPSVETDADGSFEVTVGQAGTYVVSATDNRGKVRSVLDLAADGESVELVLQDPGGIRGLVTLAGGAPAPNATIAVVRFHRQGDDRAAPRSRANARTLGAADGTFALTELLPGTYDLLITAPGRADARVAGVVVAEGGWADVAVTLTEEPS